jgi:hypothetical protein
MRALIPALLSLAGCGLVCDDLPCPAPAPVEGTAVDYAPRSIVSVDVATPVPCGNTGSLILLRGLGPERFSGDDAVSESDFRRGIDEPSKREETGLHTSGFGHPFGCALDTPMVFFATDDWSRAGALVDRVGGDLAAGRLGEWAAVVVDEEVVACADQACGY